MGQDDDLWELVVNADGQRVVVHSWCHMDPYKGTAPSEGEKELSLAEFSGDKHGKRLATELSAAIKKADENV